MTSEERASCSGGSALGLGAMTRRGLCLTGVWGTLMGVAGTQRALAQGFPSRPIRLLIPYTAGGGTDALARHVAVGMGAVLEQSVVAENRAGGAGVIANEAAANAPPDGYTILLGTASTISVNPHLIRNLPYRTDAFVPIGLVATADWVLVAGEAAGITTCQGLVAAARARPGHVNIAHTGRGTAAHLFGVMAASGMGIDLTDVAYRGESMAYPDLANGNVHVMATTLNGIVLEQHRAGKLHILAVSRTERSPIAPEIPTFVECGYPQILASTWFGLFAPPGTPAAVAERLSQAAAEAVRAPNFRARVESGGFMPQSSTPAELAALLPVESHRWGDLIRQHDIKLE